MMSRVGVLRLGLSRYADSLAVQKATAQKVKDHALDGVIILTEHYPVYTIGIRTRNYNLEDKEKLEALGAEFYKTSRGGLITFHGPGQLVVYPILHLKKMNLGVRKYVCALEQSVINVCSKLNLSASRSEHTGVWLGDKKVAAIGIRASQFISLHGLAINCNVDLSWFNYIIPCGIPDKGVTSLSAALNKDISCSDIERMYLGSFSSVFKCEIVDEIEKNAVKS